MVCALCCVLLIQLLLTTWLSGVQGATDCTFTIPSIDDPSSCVLYNLTAVDSQGPYKLSVDGNDYIFSLCDDVDAVFLPDNCSSLANNNSAVAYQYNSSSQQQCQALGRTREESTYTYSVDPQSSSKGVRVGYGDGDIGKGAIWPRAIILDLICDATALNGNPLSIVEYPPYTYTVRWVSDQFCPTKVVMGSCPVRRFEATWDSVRFRPKPTWFDEVKFGIFIHWGVFSVPSYTGEWYWQYLMSGKPQVVEFHNRVYGCSGVEPDKYPCEGPAFKYADFAPLFKAELFNPDKWADLFKKAGAKYVVLTSKHHEGWCNYPSNYHWNWNSVDEGPHRDLVGDLTKSVKAAGLHMGLYYSLREWYNPLYIQDQKDNCNTTAFTDEVILPSLKEVVVKYKPELIWVDGPGDNECTRDSKYWKAPEFLSWLYNDSPVKDTVMANSRWGFSPSPHFGDYETGVDWYTPGKLVPYKWESCYTVQKASWGYDRNGALDDYHTASSLLFQLVSSVSCNGNLLLNVGPTADGRILPTFEERLLQMGAWLEVNGEAIYNSTPWRAQNDTPKKQTWYTASKDGRAVYAISFVAPIPGRDVVLYQPITTDSTEVTLLGYGTLRSSRKADGLHIAPPYNSTLQYAWTYKLVGVM